MAMTKAQELAAEINEATVALFDPSNKTRTSELLAQAQEAYCHAEQLNLSPKAWHRVQYAMAQFEVQYKGHTEAQR